MTLAAEQLSTSCVPNNRPYAAPNAGRMPETPELVVFSRDVKQYAVQRVENAIAAGGRHETFVCVRLYFVFPAHARTPRMLEIL